MSMNKHGIATCPMCRATLVTHSLESTLYTHANRTDEHMRQRLPHELLTEIDELVSRHHRTNAEQYELSRKVINVATVMFSLDMDVDLDIVAGFEAFVEEYEKAHRIRILPARVLDTWRRVKDRSRGLRGLRQHTNQ
jgi:hypothetical protein